MSSCRIRVSDLTERRQWLLKMTDARTHAVNGRDGFKVRRKEKAAFLNLTAVTEPG